jgi:hypothetical protein
MKKKLILILIVIGFLVYFNSLFNGFVWDDEEQIINNEKVHSITNIPQFFQESTFNSGGSISLNGTYYRPLMMTVFSIIYQLFGPRPFFYHLFQLGVHIINALLIFYLFTYLGFSSLLSFFLTTIFLIHPINTEAVSYISALQDVLYIFFGLIAILITIKNKHNNTKNILLINLFIFLGFLTKETAGFFILLILFYNFLYKRDNIKYFVFFIFIIGFYLILRLGVAGIFFTKFHFAPIAQISLKERILMIPAVLFYYLKTFFFPKDLAVMQHWLIKTIDLKNFFIPLFFEVIFFSALFFLFKKSKKFIFFLFWFWILILPHLQIFALDMTVAERWFYGPMIGLLGTIGAIFNFQQAVFKKLIPVFILIVFLFSVRTIIRNKDWKNGLTLFSHDVQISKNSFDLENNLGVELFRVKKYDQAKIHFENSCRLSPTWWVNWNNLGAVYERKNNLKQAKKLYEKAIAYGDYYLAYENYINILLKEKKYSEVKEFIETKAFRKFPYNQTIQKVYYFLLTNPK